MLVQLGVAYAVVVARANLDAIVLRTDLLSARIFVATWSAASKVFPGASLASDSVSDSRS